MKGERSKARGGRGSEANIYYWEVLHRVLYPNTHGNGNKKKKKKKLYIHLIFPNLKIYYCTTRFYVT